ncbi:hypothetical protein [Kocuria rosea]|uniref:hypothetical protein n=1 Tax=Kocuria rosea TaxID=1275 RepID=UPI0020404A68|nr:hypothetical protein [Kocuria rosea]MCM3689437.1 hypothetical protein [Kocuria rosea]
MTATCCLALLPGAALVVLVDGRWAALMVLCGLVLAGSGALGEERARRGQRLGLDELAGALAPRGEAVPALHVRRDLSGVH